MGFCSRWPGPAPSSTTATSALPARYICTRFLARSALKPLVGFVYGRHATSRALTNWFPTPCISTQLREEAAKANGSTVKGRLFQSNAFKLLMMNAEEAAAAATANRPRMRQSAVPRTLCVSVDSVCTTFPMVNTQPRSVALRSRGTRDSAAAARPAPPKDSQAGRGGRRVSRRCGGTWGTQRRSGAGWKWGKADVLTRREVVRRSRT